MKNCIKCKFQLMDTDIICPVCGMKNVEETKEMNTIEEVDEKPAIDEEAYEAQDNLGERNEDFEEKTAEEKEYQEKRNTDVLKENTEEMNHNSKYAVAYKDIGCNAQVEISFSDGSSICLRKTVARMIYPTIFM